MENPGLKNNVVSMYNSKIKTENLLMPRIEKNIKITDKYGVEHVVDVYFEFIQMNNLERTLIKTISGRKVTQEDVEKFKNTVSNFSFWAKSIIFYDLEVSDKAKEVAKKTNIELKKFDFQREIIKDSIQKIKGVLPNEEVVGDPFWIIMETEGSKNIGNYYACDNRIPLFLSKKQAVLFCNNLTNGNNYQVCGVSQFHLDVLVRMSYVTKIMFLVMLPDFLQLDYKKVCGIPISYTELQRFYVRSRKIE